MRLFATKDKEKHYSYKKIDETGAIYRVIIGQRSNGKTYGYLKKVVDEFIDNGNPSVYLRRYAEDIQPGNISALFNPFLKYIEQRTKGTYNNVVYRTKTFCFAYIDDDGKTIRKSDPVMYTCALSNWERSKGSDRGFVKYICFDEFMTRTQYIANEFSKFTNVLSSYIRDRDGTIIYMLANTVNKYCPYFEEMGLRDTERQPKGTINLYDYNNKSLTVAVEYCHESLNVEEVKKYYAFDNPNTAMITTGSWEEDSYPHLEEFSVSKDTCMLRFYLVFNMSMVIGEIHHKSHEMFVFFHNAPEGKKRPVPEPTDMVFTNHPTKNYLWLNAFGQIPPIDPEKCRAYKLLYSLLNQEKDFYSTNTVGEIVRNFVVNPKQTLKRK